MPDLNKRPAPVTVRRASLGILMAMLVLVCAIVLRPFWTSIAWAVILAYISWPAHRRVRSLCRNHQTPAALVMTLLVALVLIVPMIWMAALLQDEIAAAYQAILSNRAGESHAQPAVLRTVPWFGELLQQAYDRYAADPLLMRESLIVWAQQFRVELLGFAGDVGRNIAKLFLTIATLFFLYRDGESLVQQAARILRRLFDDRLDRYLRAAGAMTRAVIFGLLVTAVVQGTVAGIGYAVFSVNAPILLGALTAVASIIPILGTFLIWGSAGLWLALNGHLWAGVGLLVWGTLLVHPADNVIRPLLISNVTQLPFLLVMFGVLGGLAAFGLVGLFIGPMALAVATAVWREWAE
jgi:predicted PurR-regulated permease PerM